MTKLSNKSGKERVKEFTEKSVVIALNKRLKLVILAVAGGIVAIIAAVVGMQFVNDSGADIASLPVSDVAEQVNRGSYLARVGDCEVCHTARDGMPYAGGRSIHTQYGTVYTPNITFDQKTGIGLWSSDDFWRAMHNGKSKDGKFLYPVFPYPSYTKINRADSDALFAFLKTMAPVNETNHEQQLRFPYNERALLAFWRALYFRPGIYENRLDQSVQWNRGAYLVQGLGHCNACHTARNSLGAEDTRDELEGGLIPILNWYAPSLTSDSEAGLANWDEKDIFDLLKTGVSSRGAVFGPMADVVENSMQYLDDGDVNAIARYLKSLKSGGPDDNAMTDTSSPLSTVNFLGGQLYTKNCMGCHLKNGKGYPPAYPPLVGNHALTTSSNVNAIRMVLDGGFPPSTHGNPRPYGMPPFGYALTDTEVAALVSYMRNAWGNQPGLVSPNEVNKYRDIPLD